MQTLPYEILQIIFVNINKLTDKRQFTRTCKKYYKITKGLLKIYSSRFEVKPFSKIRKYCPKKFTLELCHDDYFHLIPESYFNDPKIMEIFAFYNKPNLIEKVLAKGNHLPEHIYYAPIMNGNLELLIWFKEHNCQLTTKSFLVAIMYGHLNIIKWVCDNEPNIDTSDGASYASNYGHTHVLEWMKLTYGIENMKGYLCDRAAKGGHIDTLKWLQNNNFNWDENTCSFSALNGHLNVLIFLKNNGCPMDNFTCDFAAFGGHLDVLLWSLENGCILNENTIKWSKIGCHQNILTYMKNNNYEIEIGISIDKRYIEEINTYIYKGCRNVDEIYLFAAKKGNLDMIKCIKEYGLIFDENICIYSAEYGHTNILKYLILNEQKGIAECSVICAASYGYLDILIWAKENGIIFPIEIIPIAIEGGHENVIEWLKSNM
jgi:hypothetical protein